MVSFYFYKCFVFTTCFYYVTYHYSCCNATASGLRSCSNPLSSNMTSMNPTDNICPAAPKLSSSSIQGESRGSLESDNVFMAEHLLRVFAGVTGRPEFLLRSFQAGFTVNLREPSDSVCGCNRSQGILDFFSSNSTCNSPVQVLFLFL